MKYLVCEKMIEEGCDYTIGCGMRYSFIEAGTVEEAAFQLVWPDGVGEYSAVEGEMALGEILIVPAEHVRSVNIKAMHAQSRADMRAFESAEIEEEERKQLAELQAKYAT